MGQWGFYFLDPPEVWGNDEDVGRYPGSTVPPGSKVSARMQK